MNETRCIAIEFNVPEQCAQVWALLQQGYTFQQAVDQLEYRPNLHYTATLETPKGTP